MCRAVMLLVLLVAVPAFGQSTYVAGSVGADISRFSRFDVAGVDVGGLTGGEAVSAAVRVNRRHVFPQPVGFRISLRQRTTTLSAVAGVRQRAAQAVDLVYLAGVGFNRTCRRPRSHLARSRLGGRS